MYSSHEMCCCTEVIKGVVVQKSKHVLLYRSHERCYCTVVMKGVIVQKS